MPLPHGPRFWNITIGATLAHASAQFGAAMLFAFTPKFCVMNVWACERSLCEPLEEWLYVWLAISWPSAMVALYDEIVEACPLSQLPTTNHVKWPPVAFSAA